jgi:hypothetical protein
VDRFFLDTGGRQDASGLLADCRVTPSELVDDYDWNALQIGSERSHVGRTKIGNQDNSSAARGHGQPPPPSGT